MTVPNVIEIDSLYKTYQNEGLETEVLRGISITVEEGDYISIIGPSGAGKSTLMTIVGCLAQPTSGTYLLDGEEVDRLNDRQLSRIRNEKIGFVFQAFHLLPGVSAFNNVMMPLIYCRKTPKEAEERVERALKRVGLEHRMDHTPGRLSGGEQQRVTIARSLINDPKILLADEPTGNLDSKNGAEIMAAFDQLNAEGRTIVIITHDPVVAGHARRILTLKDGRIESDRINENFQKSGTSPARAPAE
ncbi:macrolide ABC transporter ATP-binding protein [Candidatus Nitromaritima sp. SCGC AAA799-A02]|nr:macrolide ABC transporter ATP-binding protein [Candidatus Nitromaritima sp. SCGC AAA799-A02]KMP11757.1 macrolide ABC transporter ATP-binding protein [Candidatus Nitromaritima sp. SCGC AAA799-C22]